MIFEYAARLSNDGKHVRVWSVNYQGYAEDIPAEEFPDWYVDFMMSFDPKSVWTFHRPRPVAQR